MLLGVGAVLLSSVHSQAPPDPSHTVRRRRVLSELGAGFRYVWSDPRPRVLIGTLGLWTFVLGFIDTLIVVLALEVLGIGQTGVGALNAAVGVGGVIGAAFAVVAGNRERLFPRVPNGLARVRRPRGGDRGDPHARAALARASRARAPSCTTCPGRTMLQRLIPDQKLTRCLGVLESVYMGSEGLGAFAAAILVTLVGPRWTFAIAGAIIPVTFFVLRRSLRAVDVGARVPADDLALLRRTSLFEPLPIAAVERLARNSVPLVVDAGTTIIREGDAGDRVYVIASGEADVSSNGSHVARLGPARTWARSPCSVTCPARPPWSPRPPFGSSSLERDVFLRTMTGHEPARAAATRPPRAGRASSPLPEPPGTEAPRTAEPQGPIRRVETHQVKTCPHCGGEIRDSVVRCTHCRRNLRDGEIDLETAPAGEPSRPAELTVWPPTRGRVGGERTVGDRRGAAQPSRRAVRLDAASRCVVEPSPPTSPLSDPSTHPRDPELPARVRPGHVDAVGRDGGDRRRDLGVPRGEGAPGASHSCGSSTAAISCVRHHGQVR